ncbi:MAG TPA: sigma-70 family RNA polymerase sigma factor [Actinomycetota bacterium]
MESTLAGISDLDLISRLRDGDEATFMRLVDSLGPSMLRVARMYVRSRAVAEDVVQDAWIGVLQGIDRFEGRSSLRTWIFRIVTNIAKTRGQREGRSVPFASLAGDDLDAPSFDPSMFLASDDPRGPGHWSTLPTDWRTIPEDRLVARETLDVAERAIETLPPMQAEVIRLRDVRGWTSEEVRNALDLSETNQRVLLHRARAKVRRALDEYLEGEATA